MFSWKRLKTLSQKQVENNVPSCSYIKHGNIRFIKFLNILDYKIPKSCGIFCREPDNIFWKIFSENIFLKRLFFSFLRFLVEKGALI